MDNQEKIILIEPHTHFSRGEKNDPKFKEIGKGYSITWIQNDRLYSSKFYSIKIKNGVYDTYEIFENENLIEKIAIPLGSPNDLVHDLVLDKADKIMHKFPNYSVEEISNSSMFQRRININ